MISTFAKGAALALAVTGASQINSCEDPTPTPTPTKLAWYYTCGDPVCSGHDPHPGVPTCTGQQEGDPCTQEGATCDPMNDCNQLMVCAAEDPKQQQGGCPISRAAMKTGIQYLDDAQKSRLHEEVLGIKLATYKYVRAGEDARTHLGFIIDDNPASLSVDRDRDMIDLYGYTSMTVAAVQSQQAQIQGLKAELDAMKKEMASCRAAAAPR